MKIVLNAVLIATLAAGAFSVMPAPLAAQSAYGTWSTQGDRGWGSRYAPDVRLWLENDREIFQHGERMQLRFRTAEDAYVAVLHVDTDGEVELVYPEGAWDDSFVRGGRTYALPRGRSDGYWTVRSRSGIGYFHVVASVEPLNLREFERFSGGARGGPFNGRTVRGDPFYALETLTRLLVGSPNVPYGVDTYSYSVGGRYRYPGYACSDAYASSAWDWGSYYGSCDRVLGLLRNEPYYYDTRRYRRDRDRYFREWPDQPRHGYKEPATGQGSRAPVPARAVAPSGYDTPRAQPNPAPREGEARTPRVTRPQPQPSQQQPAARPEPQRPRLERRPEPQAQPAPAPAAPRAEPKKQPPSPPSESTAPRVRRPDPEG